MSSQVSLLVSLHSSCERKRSLTNLKGVAFRNSIPTGLRLIDYDRQISKAAAPKNISELGSLVTGALRSFNSDQDRIRCT